MLGILLTHVASHAVLAASQSNGELFLLAGPAGGGAFYFFYWRYYRNTDKTHSFERETRIAAQPVTGTDGKVGEVKGTRASRIERSNDSDHRERVQRIP